MPSRYKSITYKYLNSSKSSLIVICPQAMQTSNDSQQLISSLKTYADILFIESGYYGITKINSDSQVDVYSANNFKSNLHELIQKFPHKRVFLVAGSVGAIHALSYLGSFPTEIFLVCLTGPALYKNRGIFINNLFRSFLSVELLLGPDSFFRLVTTLLKNYPKTSWLQTTYENVRKKIGARSYFLCLKEIVDFTTTKRNAVCETIVSGKVHIFLGDQDKAFNWLCDKELCDLAKSCLWIKSDHSALNTASKELANLIKGSVI